MKECSSFPKAPGLELHHQIVCHIENNLWVGVCLTLLQRCSQSIQHPQPSGLKRRRKRRERGGGKNGKEECGG